MAGGTRKILKERGNNGAIPVQGVLYRVAGIEIDPTNASVTRAGQPISLRHKTYRVLLFLLERPNRLVSKEELIEGVWVDTAVSDDVLTHCIAELRKVFGDDAKDPRVIRTYPKAGYGLTAPVEVQEVEAAETAPFPPPTQGRPPRKFPPWIAVVGGAILLLAAVGAARLRGMKPAPEENLREAAWWKLDEAKGLSALDSSGNGLRGQLTGGAAWVPGKRSAGVAFSGLEDAITGKAARPLPGGSAPRTITAWFKTAAAPVEDTAIFEYGSDFRGPTAERFTLTMGPDGHISFGACIQGGFSTSAGQWADNTWHMAAVTYEGPLTNRASIFVDGRLDQAGKWIAAAATNNRLSWRIGRSLLGNSPFLGAIDDVRVYSAALDASKIDALYRCSTQSHDLGGYYYLPVFYPGLAIEDRRAGDSSAPLRQAGIGLTGMQLAVPHGDCGISSLRGADAGQDLRIAADILVPIDAEGRTTEAGPYFRSRAAMAGDGIIGGESAGYWLQLQSTGIILVKRLNPQAVVAFSNPDPAFDSAVFHHLEMEARGEMLTAWLDGKPVEFLQGGAGVSIPPVWDGPPRLGQNQGAAGIGFSSDQSRGKAGGQRVKNLQVSRLEP
jgi:DNA-binding winged helix-turn-helix (wHTH) protein